MCDMNNTLYRNNRIGVVEEKIYELEGIKMKHMRKKLKKAFISVSCGTILSCLIYMEL